MRAKNRKPMADDMVVTANLHNCTVGLPKKKRAGHPNTFRIDLSMDDSRQCAKYVCAVDSVDKLQKWMAAIKQAAACKIIVHCGSRAPEPEPEPEPDWGGDSGLEPQLALIPEGMPQKRPRSKTASMDTPAQQLGRDSTAAGA